MADQREEMQIYSGVGVSPGITFGKVLVVDRKRIVATPVCLIDKNQIPKEIERFKDAVKQSKMQLEEIKSKISAKAIAEHLNILDAQQRILEDDMLIKETIQTIEQEKINAEWAIERTMHEFQKVLDEVDDDYLRDRKNDLDYIEQRILRNLIGKRQKRIFDIQDEVILVARDLSPADTAQMSKEKIKGFLTDVGGKTSHTAIMSRALEIPAVVGLETITKNIATGDQAIVDGSRGIVVVKPTAEILDEYVERQRQYKHLEEKHLPYGRLPAETADGYRVKICANIELIEEVPSILVHGAEGIGLYRTEFLYLKRKELPTEEEHYDVYKKTLEMMAPHPVTIRTLDIGGDKFASELDLAEEMNPAMGLRAIRFSLKEIDIFKNQLRGILRASAHGELKILFPMISGVKEIRDVKAILDEVKDELRRQEVPFNPNVPIGIMIEIPSAVAVADFLAKEIDFFSIGTNDLIQYALAIDRVNEHVNYLYEPLHPAVLRLIRDVVHAGHDAGIPVGMCGEMAGEPLYTPILLGLELDELSMNAAGIPVIKKVIRSLSRKESKQITEAIFEFSTTSEIHAYVERRMKELFPEEFMTIEGS